MSEITLIAETGRTTGSRSSGRLRAAGKIPGVVYGHGMTPVSVAVDRRELRHALTGAAGLNAVINLSLDGTTHATVVKDMQRDVVRRNVTHVDFIVVNLNEEIEVEVPIHVTGEAKAVVNEGGMVDQQLLTLTVATTPRNIPNSLTVDISDLQPGDQIKVSDLPLPANVTTPLDPDTLVVITLLTRAGVEALTTEGQEGEGGADATAADADKD
jgi:large subunit ribosomal protein L25